MAKIVLCNACSGQVSSSALSCPHCGQPLRRAPKQYGCFSVVFVLFLLAFSIAIFSNAVNGPSSPSPTPTPTATEPPKSPAQVAQETAATDALGHAVLFMNVLKSSMRNPASFRVERALQVDGTNDICFQYMAQNGFGGMNQGYAVYDAKTYKFKIETMSGFYALWKKDCNGKHGTEHALTE